MELTGRAKIDFNDWLNAKYSSVQLRFTPYIAEYSYLMEWLDSVGLYIDRDTQERTMKIWDYISEEPAEPIEIDCTYEELPIHWYREAIKKSIEIYNSNK